MYHMFFIGHQENAFDLFYNIKTCLHYINDKNISTSPIPFKIPEHTSARAHTQLYCYGTRKTTKCFIIIFISEINENTDGQI